MINVCQDTKGPIEKQVEVLEKRSFEIFLNLVIWIDDFRLLHSQVLEYYEAGNYEKLTEFMQKLNLMRHQIRMAEKMATSKTRGSKRIVISELKNEYTNQHVMVVKREVSNCDICKELFEARDDDKFFYLDPERWCKLVTSLPESDNSSSVITEVDEEFAKPYYLKEIIKWTRKALEIPESFNMWEFQQNMVRLKSLNESMSEKLEHCRKKNQELMRKNKEWKAKFDGNEDSDKENQFKRRLKEMDDECRKLKREFETKMSMVRKLKLEKSLLQGELNQKVEELQRERVKCEELSTSAAQAKINELEEELLKVQLENISTLAEKSAIEAELDKSKLELSETRQELEQSQAAKKEVEEKLVQSDAEKMEMQDKLERSMNEKSEIEKKLEKVQCENSLNLEKLEQTETEKEEIQEKLKKYESNTKKLVKSQSEDCLNQTTLEQLEREKNEIQKNYDEVTKQIRTCRRRLEQVETEKMEIERNFDTYKAENLAKQNTFRKVNEELAAKKTAFYQLQTQLDKVTSESRKELEQLKAEKQAIQDQLAKADLDRSLYEKQCKQLENEMNRYQVRMETRLKQLEKDGSANQVKLELERKLTEAKAEIESLKTRLEKLTEDNRVLTRRTEHDTTLLIQFKNQLDLKENELNRVDATHKAELDSLNHRLEEVDKKLERSMIAAGHRSAVIDYSALVPLFGGEVKLKFPHLFNRNHDDWAQVEIECNLCKSERCIFAPYMQKMCIQPKLVCGSINADMILLCYGEDLFKFIFPKLNLPNGNILNLLYKTTEIPSRVLGILQCISKNPNYHQLFNSNNNNADDDNNNNGDDEDQSAERTNDNKKESGERKKKGKKRNSEEPVASTSSSTSSPSISSPTPSTSSQEPQQRRIEPIRLKKKSDKTHKYTVVPK